LSGDPVDLVLELELLLGALLLRLQLPLLVLPDVGDADVAAEVLEHAVLDGVHLVLGRLNLLLPFPHGRLDLTNLGRKLLQLLPHLLHLLL